MKPLAWMIDRKPLPYCTKDHRLSGRLQYVGSNRSEKDINFIDIGFQ